MAFLSRIFGSRQIRDCEKALGLLGPYFTEVSVFPILEARILALLRKHPQQVEQKMLIEGHSARQVVLQLLGGIAYGECESGQNHTYRGTLSMAGREYRQAVGIVHQRLIEMGALDPEEAAAIRDDLAQAIKEAG
ncbi:MAG: hypothetical protein AABY88_12375 [Pseudomonadota bacterium]